MTTKKLFPFICHRVGCLKFLALHPSFILDDLNKPLMTELDYASILEKLIEKEAKIKGVSSNSDSDRVVEQSSDSSGKGTPSGISSSSPSPASPPILDVRSHSPQTPVSETVPSVSYQERPSFLSKFTGRHHIEKSLSIPSMNVHTPATNQSQSLSSSNPPHVGKTQENSELLDPLLYHVGNLLKEATVQYEMDFPLCTECSGYVKEELNQAITHIDQEIVSFIYYEPDIDFDESELLCLKQEISQLEKEKNDLLMSTSKLEEIRLTLQEKLDILNETKDNMAILEHEYWITYGELCAEREQFNVEYRSLLDQLEYSKDCLRKVQETFILNDAFHVWHHGHFGTVNGYRLGRLTSQPIDWNDINAAWGMVAILVTQLAKNLEYEFEHYVIYPMGSQSKIITVDNTQYELFGDRDSPFYIFSAHLYDKAMQAILECIGQLIDYVKKLDSEFNVPYEIVGDKINGHSVKLQFNPEDKWTKALKYMLTNLKFLVAWLSVHRDITTLKNEALQSQLK